MPAGYDPFARRIVEEAIAEYADVSHPKLTRFDRDLSVEENPVVAAPNNDVIPVDIVTIRDAPPELTIDGLIIHALDKSKPMLALYANSVYGDKILTGSALADVACHGAALVVTNVLAMLHAHGMRVSIVREDGVLVDSRVGASKRMTDRDKRRMENDRMMDDPLVEDILYEVAYGRDGITTLEE